MTLPRGRLLKASTFGAAAGAPRPVASPGAAHPGVDRAQADEHDIDRIVNLSRLLAERLIGRELEIDPTTIVSLARGVLMEARSVRDVRVFVHPVHVGLLEGAAHAIDPDGRVREVRADASLGPGDVRLETELGIVDARIRAELDGLAERLRMALRS